MSAFGLRRYFVAKEKLAIIREELTKRGVPLHDMDKRDAYVYTLHTLYAPLLPSEPAAGQTVTDQWTIRDSAIPLGASAVGVGLGAGISHLVGGVIATPGPDVPVIGPHHDAGGVFHFMHADPEAAAHGFAEGLSDQANAVGHVVHEAVLSHGPEQMVTEAASEGASGHAVGYAAGIMAAKKMEELLAECIGETVFAYAMEKLLDPEIKLELKLRGKCSRLQGPLGQYCRGCGGSIRHGRFARKCFSLFCPLPLLTTIF